MKCEHVRNRLSEYDAGDLSTAEHDDIERHLDGCESCVGELLELRNLIAGVHRVPQSIDPGMNLWPSIAKRIELGRMPWWKRAVGSRVHENHRASPIGHLSPAKKGRRPGLKPVLGLGLALTTIAIVGLWYGRQSNPVDGWSVDRIDGSPRVGASAISGSSYAGAGESVETDGQSRARISLGEIGQVMVEPGSTVRLLAARRDDHRIALDRGAIRASVSAPPRIFSVETPTAVAVDLGCEYRLAVDDDGRALLHVTAGYVALEWNNRTSIVPAGTMCRTGLSTGPGTPFSEYATAQFRAALAQFDASADASESLSTILALSTAEDAVTLWHLIERTDGEARAHVVDRLASFVPRPAGVSRSGILRLDEAMLLRWWGEFAPVPPGLKRSRSPWKKIHSLLSDVVRF